MTVTRTLVAQHLLGASVFAAVRERFSRLDVLHSNAGIFLGHGIGNDGPLRRWTWTPGGECST